MDSSSTSTLEYFPNHHQFHIAVNIKLFILYYAMFKHMVEQRSWDGHIIISTIHTKSGHMSRHIWE